jgi:hypothetical protein
VIDGPFSETKELVAGYWLWEVKSKQEAIEWVKRCPNPTGAESEIEIRQVFEAADFGAEFTPELREQEERLRAQIRGEGEELSVRSTAGASCTRPAAAPAAHGSRARSRRGYALPRRGRRLPRAPARPSLFPAEPPP